jgi:hypothetical protein
LADLTQVKSDVGVWRVHGGGWLIWVSSSLVLTAHSNNRSI